MDYTFQVPLELMAENVSKHNDSKSMTNYDVFTVIQTLIDRVNDLYTVVLALDGFDVETKKILISPENLNSNILSYINLINTLIDSIREKAEIIENNLSLNGD